LKRLFFLSFGVGLAASVAAAWLFPLPQHDRFRSRIEVLTNGGRQESFVIRWPQDRITLPAALAGTDSARSAGTLILASADQSSLSAAELFRLRDVDGNVIGLASRLTGRVPGQRVSTASVSNWMLLIPSRGTLLMTQENSADTGPVATSGGYVMPADVARFWAPGSRFRITAGPAAGAQGRVLSGTDEFKGLTGSYTELWELEEVAVDGRTEGRISLMTVISAREP
jgi:hypothetical protein